MMIEVGQSPIQLSREINGFVVNRLQSALLGEAFRLVEDGLCACEDVDKAVRDGLGLRWFFMGPFETIDLNAREGVPEYCRDLGAMYYGLAKEQADPREWAPPLVKNVEDQRSQVLRRSELAARQRWRDDHLAELVEAKKHIFSSST
jgi:L-gulonate 3-dehydrogenase